MSAVIDFKELVKLLDQTILKCTWLIRNMAVITDIIHCIAQKKKKKSFLAFKTSERVAHSTKTQMYFSFSTPGNIYNGFCISTFRSQLAK